MGGFLSGRTSLTTVLTADIADDAITEAKMATDAIGITELKAGTDGNIISYDASGDPVAIATGDDGQVLTSAGAGAQPAFEALSAGFTLATEQATTSGTSITFGSIPSGTKMIVIMFEGVSITSTNELNVTIGDSGGLETSGYVSICNQELDSASYMGVSTAEFVVRSIAAANLMSGHMILTLKDSSNFTWISSHMARTANNSIVYGGGHKSLSAELTQVSLSGGTFDAGSVNIMYQ